MECLRVFMWVFVDLFVNSNDNPLLSFFPFISYLRNRSKTHKQFSNIIDYYRKSCQTIKTIEFIRLHATRQVLNTSMQQLCYFCQRLAQHRSELKRFLNETNPHYCRFISYHVILRHPPTWSYCDSTSPASNEATETSPSITQLIWSIRIIPIK